jgi:signal transduction histidine kinase/CheY-like chemotaxis protein
VPFAKAPLVHIDAFIPAYQSAVAINDMITTVLLFGQFTILRKRGLLLLGCGYLFTGLMALMHMASFPGLFAPTGLLGAGPQTTVWLYMFWHIGLPVLVIAHALDKKNGDGGAALANGNGHEARRTIAIAVASVIAAVFVLVLLTTAGQAIMPTLLIPTEGGAVYSIVYRIVLAAVCVLAGTALVLLWRRKPHSVLDLWLMVVMCAWIFDIALSAMLNQRRFDLGFYAGRLYGLMAASFILLVLLLETRALFSRLARSLERQRAEATSRADELRRSEDALRRLNETLEQRVAERSQQLEAQSAERDRIRETLRESQKLEAIGQMSGGIAHDFNNLLTIMMGNAGFLEDRLPSGPERQAAAAVGRAAERGARLVRQILAFSRRQSVKPEVLELAPRSNELVDMLQRSTRGDIRIVADFADDLWPFECDVAELELALMNLCVNARDAMPSGGVVRVEARNIARGASLGAEATGPETHRIGGLENGTARMAPGDFVRLAVVDGGTGIAPELLTKVFEPFFTTKEIGKGTGLGLSQVYGFAQQAGGAAEISSAIGTGTTVAIYLPRAEKAEMADTAAPRAAIQDRGGVALLVEDDDDVATVAATILGTIGYRAQHVRNAGNALALLLGGQRFDLVLSDIVMPGGMNGLEMARKIRQHFPWLPILLSTGFARSAVEVHQAGFEIIAKPYNAASLLDAIVKVRAAAAATEESAAIKA